MSTQPTTYSQPHEAIHNPYQPPPSFTHLGNQAQGGQPHIIASPGIFANSQQSQGNVQMLSPAIGTATIPFKEEGKTLGAIQIVIGLIHMGFGIILGLMNVVYLSVLGFASVTFVSGYPFWGGLSFVITGALSIAACKQFSLCMLKANLGMNIVSSIFSFVGVLMLLVDEGVNGHTNQDYWALIAGRGISAMLIISSLAEFCINCTTAHFANQVITNTTGKFANDITKDERQSSRGNADNMAPCACSKISTADTLVLGAIQILIGIFHVCMWYFLLTLYLGQIKGRFGTYEPLTYKTGCALWGIIFIISGAILIRVARHPTQRLVICALVMNIFCIMTTIVSTALIAVELSSFHSLSYRNFGQAKLGREVSRILLFSNSLELGIAFTYTIFSSFDLSRSKEETFITVAKEAESAF